MLLQRAFCIEASLTEAREAATIVEQLENLGRLEICVVSVLPESPFFLSRGGQCPVIVRMFMSLVVLLLMMMMMMLMLLLLLLVKFSTDILSHAVGAADLFTFFSLGTQHPRS